MANTFFDRIASAFHKSTSAIVIASMTLMLVAVVGPTSISQAATARSCPVTDGGAGDSDATVDGTITINANATWDTTGFTALGDYWDCSGKTIHVTNNSTLTFQGDTVNGWYPYLQAANVTVDSGSKITGSGQGCNAAGNSTGKGPNGSNVCVAGNGGGVGASQSTTGAGGGANGGDGGAGTSQAAGTHQSFTKTPSRFGAAGGSGNAGLGGVGGGVVRMNLTGTLTLNGNIESNGLTGGTNSTNRAGGGGAGGSIYIDVDTVAGANGVLQANGGSGADNASADGGGGGGGLVALYYNTDSYTNNLTPNQINVNGGSGPGSAGDGAKGTAYIEEKDANSEVYAHQYYTDGTAISNASGPLTFDQMNMVCDSGTSSITLSSSDALTFGGTLTCSDGSLTDVDFVAGAGGLNLIDGATLSFLVPNLDLDFTLPANSTSNWNNVTISTGNLSDFVINDAATINLQGNTAINSNVNWTNLKGLSTSSSAVINANILGCYDAYPGSTQAGKADDGTGSCVRGQAGAGAGGSHAGGGGHGGAGAAGASASGGAAIGDANSPALYGSTGGHTNESNSAPGIGGGKVIIDVAGNVAHSGVITANGGTPSNALTNRSPGGGSGGSIKITLTGEFSGTNGSLSAAGGAPNTGGSQDAGGGGGGRIYVLYGTNTSNYLTGLSASTAAPGGGSGGRQGSTGTLVKTAPPTPPNSPSISAPTSNQTGVGLNPTVTTGSYAGTGDAHQYTDWKIVNNGDACSATAITENLASTTDLTTSNVNDLNWTFASGSSLRYNTAYRLCVRHVSNNNNTSSEWAMQSFTTENLASWAGYHTLRATNSNAGNLTDYQVRIQVSNVWFNFADARSDAADIRFSDAGGGTAYPHYIADWDSNAQTGVIWVKVPSISGSNGTADFRMYYGNNSATSIPTTAGESVFLQFWDEDNFSDWDNGSNNSQFTTFAKDGDNWNVGDGSGAQTQDAQVSVNSAVSALTSVTLETRLKMNNVSNVSDNLIILTGDDAGYANRAGQIWMPYYTNQAVYGLQESGTNKAISGATFAFDVFKELSIKHNISGGDYDYYIKNTDGTAFTTIANRAKAKGAPSNINIVRIVTAGQNSHKSDVDIDFMAFRVLADAEPTIVPVGNAPSSPSVTSPSSGATQQFTNPSIQSSNFSGDFAHVSTDAKIMTGNSCSSGTPVWEMTDNTIALTSFTVNSYFGSFGGALSGKDALNFNTTYYACVRHTNLVGDSAWSSPLAFTTEDLGGFSRTTTATISNSGSELTNHQVRIVLNSSNFDFASTLSSGADIRFTSSDNSLAYPHYIESYDQGGSTAVIWIRVDSLPNAGDQTVNIHYDNSAKNQFPSDNGESVFLEFIDENDVSRFVNGATGSSGFDSITSDSNAIRFQDTDASTSAGAEIAVGGLVPSLDTYTIETRLRVLDTDATDSFLIAPQDGTPGDQTFGNRNWVVGIPLYTDQDAFGQVNGGNTAWNKIGDGSFAFDTYFNLVTDMFENAGDTDIYFYDQARSLLASADQNSPTVGPQSQTNGMYFFTRSSSPANKTDTYLDYMAFRQYTSNTIGVSIIGGPTVSSLTATEATDGTGNVTVGFTIDSIGDSAQVQAKLEYSIDGGSTWADPTLLSGTVAASTGGTPTLDNAQTYQIGKSGGWIDTSGGAVNVSVKWDANTDTNEDDNDMQIRVTGYDNVSSFAGLSLASSSAVLDVVAPTAPGSFAGTVTSSSANLSWTASTETNFDHYEVWYGTNQTDVNNMNGTATEWDDDPNDANLATRTTTSTSITGLDGETQYYFKICAVDSYGFTTCPNSITRTTGAQPTIESVAAMQKSDGSGTIDVSVTVDDADDDDTLFFTVQDNCGGSFANSTLLTTDASVTATFGDPGVSGNTIGVSGAWITTSSNTAQTKNTVQFDMNGNNCTNLEGTYQVRVTLNDGGGNITPVDTNMVVDQKAPTEPGSFAAEAASSTSLPLSWVPSDDMNFNHYEIWYGTNQTHVNAENNTATEFDNDPDDAALANIQTNSTTIVGLSAGQSVYAKICALDDYNNKTCTSSSSLTPNTIPVANQVTLTPLSNTRAQACTTVSDSDNPGTFHLGADYSTNSGNTWTKMTIVSNSVTATAGSTPSLNNGLNHQIRSIDMSAGSNTVCFNWDIGTDVANNSSALLVRFRPYDNVSEGVSGNGDGAVNEPPVALFTVTCDGLDCDFSGSGSNDPDGNITSRAWNFGDGTTSTSGSPSKTFTSAGTYMVTLLVTDNDGDTDTISKTIAVSATGGDDVSISNEPPNARFSENCSARTCSFSSSNSTDSDGTIASYLWTFGDGTTSTSASPNKTYSADGVYKVKLRITDNDGSTDQASMDVSVSSTSQKPTNDTNINKAPSASFSKSCTNLICSFDGTDSSDSDGTISSYVWTYGDGTTATGATPSKTYGAAGTYRIRLEVIDNDGASDVSFRSVEVKTSGAAVEGNVAPTADYSKSCTGLTCSFDASGSSDSDGSISNYYWSFGNGAIVTTQNSSQSFTFASSGTYKVTLVVEDNGGLKDVKRDDVGIYNSDDGGGGLSFNLDNQAPSGFGGVQAPANTSTSIDLQWNTASDDNFNRYECWYGTDATKVGNRDSSAPNGAIRWDESYDVNMMDRTGNNTSVNENISEDTTYTFKCWAKDIYGNETAVDAITQKSNDKPDLSNAAQSFTTDGLGKLNFNVDVDDNDDVPVSLTYGYNDGSGWKNMTLDSSVTADAGTPTVSGNVASGVPTSTSGNTVATTWNTQTDLPNYEGTLQIRSYANDSTENGDQAVLQNVVVDNLAPRGLANPTATFVSASRDTSRTKGAQARDAKKTNDDIPVLHAASASVTLNWTAVDDEGNWSGDAAYYVDYGLAEDSLDSQWNKTDDATLSTMTTATTTVTGLTTGTTYYFRISAVDAYGNISSLSTVSVETSTPAPVVSPGGGGGGGGGGVPLTGEQQRDDEDEEEVDDGSLPIPSHLQGDDDDEEEDVEEDTTPSISVGDTEITDEEEVETVVVTVGGSFRTELPKHWSAEYLEELLADDTVQELASNDNDFVVLLLRLLQKPDHEMNREEALQLLVALADIEISEDDRKNLNDNFSDVSPSSDLGALIEFSYQEGLITGYDDGTFRPENTINRVEALKLIQTFYGLSDEAEDHDYGTPPFGDVLRGAWYADTLMYAYDNDIVSGYQDGNFGPGDLVTYSQFLKMALLTRELGDLQPAFKE